MAIVWVALGGACGAVLRYLTVKLLSGPVSSAPALAGAGFVFPLGTLTVNVVGSLLIGLLAGSVFLDPKLALGPRLFFQTGLLGAFTTFSAFSLETLQLWHAGQLKSAAVNIVLNVTLCLAAVFAGMTLGAALSRA